MPKDIKQEQPSKEEAKQILQKEQQDRIARCGKKIQAALDEENCQFFVSMKITQQGNIPELQIIAK